MYMNFLNLSYLKWSMSYIFSILFIFILYLSNTYPYTYIWSRKKSGENHDLINLAWERLNGKLTFNIWWADNSEDKSRAGKCFIRPLRLRGYNKLALSPDREHQSLVNKLCPSHCQNLLAANIYIYIYIMKANALI